MVFFCLHLFLITDDAAEAAATTLLDRRVLGAMLINYGNKEKVSKTKTDFKISNFKISKLEIYLSTLLCIKILQSWRIKVVDSGFVVPMYSISTIDEEESEIISFSSLPVEEDEEDKDNEDSDEKSGKSKIIFKSKRNKVNEKDKACRKSY